MYRQIDGGDAKNVFNGAKKSNFAALANADNSMTKAYFKCEQFQRLHESKDKDAVELIAYHTGFYWIIPNPENKRLAKTYANQAKLNSTMRIQRKKISREAFDDEYNWQQYVI